MPSKPFRRRSQSSTKREPSGAALAKLYDIPRYDRNEITLSQINRLRDIIDLAGAVAAAERVGVSEMALLRLCAGFGHRNTRRVAEKIRAFLSGSKK